MLSGMSAPQPPFGEYAPQPQPYAWQPQLLRAPEGTNPSTLWIWLIVALPVVQMLVSIPYLASFVNLYSQMFSVVGLASTSASESPAVVREVASLFAGLIGPALLSAVVGYVLVGLGVLLGWLDWRELRRRGVPSPFHWAYGFFAFLGGGTLVYLIGRSVVVRRRTGTGSAPLWAGIAIYVALFIATMVWVVLVSAGAIGSALETFPTR